MFSGWRKLREMHEHEGGGETVNVDTLSVPGIARDAALVEGRWRLRVQVPADSALRHELMRWRDLASYEQEGLWYLARHYALSITAETTDPSSRVGEAVMQMAGEVFEVRISRLIGCREIDATRRLRYRRFYAILFAPSRSAERDASTGVH